MRKKLLATTLLSAFLLTLSPMPQALAADTVQVTLPSFSVTLNGQTTGNDYSKYPLLVYKDITYFPMTYYDCRLLGLKTDWAADTGLVIDKNEGYFYEYLREVNNSKNARKQTARIADGKITVNGKVIDNSKEEYPLLVFRDITYFPLTWRFAVNEFGWDYRFNQQEGLVIDNKKVKLENPEDGKWNEEYTAGVTGMGDGWYIIQIGRAQDVISIDHTILQQEPKNVLQPGWISFMDLSLSQKNYQKIQLSYQIYRLIENCEELVYEKILPTFYGTVKGEAVYHINTYIPYWNSPTLQNGSYRLKVGFPQDIVYYYDESGKLQPYNLIENLKFVIIQDCTVIIK